MSDAVHADVRTAVSSATGSVLNTQHVDFDSSFMAQGGDSLSAIVLAETLGTELGIDVPLELVFDAADLDDLAGQLAERLPPAGTAD
jgi:acyl carrier protein